MSHVVNHEFIIKKIKENANDLFSWYFDFVMNFIHNHFLPGNKNLKGCV